MTTPKRTLEDLLLDVVAAKTGDEQLALLDTALREAADVARQEEREAFLAAVQKASGDFYLHDQAMIAQILAWLDARSRGEEPK